MTPGAMGKFGIAVRAGLLLALLELWGPETGAQSIGKAAVGPKAEDGSFNLLQERGGGQ